MRDRYPTLLPCLKRARKLGALCVAALLGAVLGLEGQGAPVITSIDPESGTQYHRVTITGTGFGSSRGTSTVTFAGTEASRYYEWSDTEIEVRPPSSVSVGTHAVVVTVGGVASNGVDYARLPQLTAYCLSPSQTIAEPSGTFEMGVYRTGPTTDALTVTVIYTGTATHGADYTAPATLTVAAGDSRATATMAVVDDSGKEGDERINYTVRAEGHIGNNCGLTLEDDDPNGTPAPAISRVNPTSGGAEVSVEITGSNFGATKGTSTVTFNGTVAATTSWSATSITAAVPAGATTGNVLVTVGGQASNGLAFTVPPTLAISGLNPTSGQEGQSVVITGSNFGASRRTSTVTFNGTGAATTNWSATSITTAVPAGATTGNVVVTVGGVGSNGVAFTVVEPDVGVTLSCTSQISEPSGVATILALLNPGDEPGADVTFAIAHTGTADEGDDYTVGTLTIEAGERTGEMEPGLEVVDDTVSEGEETIELTLMAAGYEEAGCTIRLEDDEPAISGLEPAAGPVGTSVVITGVNFGAAQGTSTVAFNGTAATPASWSATSITAAVPAGAATGNVVVTVGGTASNGAAFTVTGVTVTPTELTIEEGGTGTYTVVLNSRPASAVTVSMFAPAGTDLSVDILPVFTASNWDEPQTVTVTAGEDEDQEDDTDTIAHRTASADAGYHDLTVDSVEVTVTDNDAGAGVRVTPRELTIEEGEEGTYTVVLNTEPSAGVTVAVTAAGDLTVMPGSLDFTTLDWDTAQEVRVTVGQDDDAEDETETITHAVTSTDTGYSGLAVDEVRVTIADDEGTGGPGGTEELTVSTTRLRITEGNMGKYTVVLNREPSAGVTVGVSAPSGGDLTVMPATLDFTTLNWDTPQEVRVTAGEDTDLEDEVESITHTITRASSSSSSSLRGALGRQAAFATAMGSPAPTREYVYLGGRLAAISQGGAVGEVSVVVTIDDDDDPDTPGVPALTNSLRLTEGHTGAYTLELGAAPTADVAIALSVSRGSDNVADVTVNPTPLTFTASDWDAPQWVTVTVAEDSDTVGETEVITHAATSTDSRYEGITIAPVRVVIRDRNPTTDPPTGTLGASPDPCTIAAGATTCSTTLTWTSMHADAIQIRKIIGQTNEVVITESGNRVSSGNAQVTGIGLTDAPFYLYEYITSTRRRGRQLATVTVKGVKALSLSPPSGPVGTVVTITGSGFGTTQGTVSFGGISASITSWSDTRIVFTVPQNATAGDHTVTVAGGGVERTIGTFRVTTMAVPTIVRFEASEEDIKTNGSSTLSWETRNADQIVLNPSNIDVTNDADDAYSVSPSTTGSHTYTLTACASNCSTDPASKKVSKTVTVTVWERPTASIRADRTTINEGQPFTLSWSSSNADSASIDQGIGPVTPNVSGSRELRPTEGTYPYTITASNPAQPPYPNATASVTVTVRPKPPGTISASPNPCTIPAGSDRCTTTLSWSSTGTTGTLVEVSHLTRAFASSGATGSQKATWIQEAPAHTYTFYLHDYMDRVQGAELARVTVTGQRPPLPMISVLNPTSGSVGDAVRLTGTSFGGSQGTSTVTFNGVKATATSWSDRTIDVRVPTGASSGSVVVTVGGQASNGVAFTVTVPARPWINDLSPPDGVVGTAVTISGVNFGNTGSVTFNATYGSPSSWSDTSISVEVPGGATSGPVVVRANGQDSNSVHFLVIQLQKEDPECEDEEDCPKDEEEGEDGEDPPPAP